MPCALMMPVKMGLPLRSVKQVRFNIIYVCGLVWAGSATAISWDTTGTITCWSVICGGRESSDFLKPLWESRLTTTYNPSNVKGKYHCSSILNSIIFSFTYVRGSKILMIISLATSFVFCSTISPSSCLGNLIYPPHFLFLFAFCLIGVWFSQPGQI